MIYDKLLKYLLRTQQCVPEFGVIPIYELDLAEKLVFNPASSNRKGQSLITLNPSSRL
jgi:hypothetical protein